MSTQSKLTLLVSSLIFAGLSALATAAPISPQPVETRAMAPTLTLPLVGLTLENSGVAEALLKKAGSMEMPAVMAVKIDVKKREAVLTLNEGRTLSLNEVTRALRHSRFSVSRERLVVPAGARLVIDGLRSQREVASLSTNLEKVGRLSAIDANKVQMGSTSARLTSMSNLKFQSVWDSVAMTPAEYPPILDDVVFGATH